MSGYPAALTTIDMDLRGLPYMPLDVVRLRDSDLAATATGEAFRAAVLLWCASWHQSPPASLPDDDAILSNLAGFGRALKDWRKVKADAMRGWIKCDDGRLYHQVVAEKAHEAWAARVKQRARTEAARTAKLRQSENSVRDNRRGNMMTEAVTQSVTNSVTDSVTSSKGREGKGREIDNPESGVATIPARDAAPPDRFAEVEMICRRALGSAAPADPVIGPMLPVVDAIGADRVEIILAAEARRERRRPIGRWSVWAQIVTERAGEYPASRTPLHETMVVDPSDPLIEFPGGRKFLASVVREHLRWHLESPRQNRWDETRFGNPPNEPGCTLPAEMLAEFGLSRIPYPEDAA